MVHLTNNAMLSSLIDPADAMVLVGAGWTLHAHQPAETRMVKRETSNNDNLKQSVGTLDFLHGSAESFIRIVLDFDFGHVTGQILTPSTYDSFQYGYVSIT